MNILNGYLTLVNPSSSMHQQSRILIVEDEAIIAAKIQLHLEQLGYTVTDSVGNGQEAVLSTRRAPPDLILMDVNLKGHLDGIETAQVLRRETTVPIVYLTANADEATFKRARGTLPEAFLTKPYRKADLERTLSLALLRGTIPPPTSAPAAAPDTTHLLTDRIFVRHKAQMVKLFLHDIHYIEAERAYCKIFTAETDYMLSIALGKLEEQLPDDKFMRIHRSYLINVEHIDAVAENCVVIDGQAVPIAKSYREDFNARINLIR